MCERLEYFAPSQLATNSSMMQHRPNLQTFFVGAPVTFAMSILLMTIARRLQWGLSQLTDGPAGLVLGLALESR